MDAERLFNQVFNCNGEEELHGLIVENAYFKNPNNCYLYGGINKDDRSNF